MEVIELKIVPNSGWICGELITESSKQGSIIIPPTAGLNALVRLRVLCKAEVDTETTETICINDTVLIKREDLLEHSQNGKKYYLLEAQFICAKIIGE